MADRRLVATTSVRDLRPLTVAGRRSVDTFEQLTRLIRRSLSPEHAALLAEPLVDEGKGTIDWYADIGPGARPLDSLAPEAQASARERLAALGDDIRALATGLERSSQASGRQLGELLQKAMQVPGDDNILVDGDRLVLVNWGHTREGLTPTRTLLEADAPRAATARATASAPAPAVATAASAPPVRRFFWPILLLWLLFAAFMAGNYHLMLEACAISNPGAGDRGWWFADFCPLTEAAAESDPVQLAFFEEQARGATLVNRRDQLAIQIAEARQECRPAMPPPLIIRPPEDAVPPEPSDDPVPEAGPAPEAEAPPEPAPPDPVPEPEPEPEPDAFDERVENEGGASGNYQVTLIWDGDADLDLYVECSAGRVFYGARQGCGGGALDIDANVGTIMPSPVENITWANRPPPGAYTVRVDNYAGRSGGPRPIPFQVRVRTPDGVTSFSGVAPPNSPPVTVHQFTVP